MNLPPLGSPRAWPPIVQALAWAALASAAVLLIGAGLAQIAALVSAQSALIAALIAGWLLATLADAPIDALARRGMARRRAVILVWLLGAIPVLVIIAELVCAGNFTQRGRVSSAPNECRDRATDRPPE